MDIIEELRSNRVFIITIILLSLLGLVVFRFGKSHLEGTNKLYSSAVQVRTVDEFNQSKENNVGYALVYGTVSTDETFNEYGEGLVVNSLAVSRTHHHRVTEHYTDSNGKRKTRRVWKTRETIYKGVKTVTFLGNTYNIDSFSLAYRTVDLNTLGIENSSNRVYSGNNDRYTFKYIPNNLHGCILMNFANNQVTFESEFYNDTIQGVLNSKSNALSMWNSLFWVIWIVLVMPCSTALILHVSNELYY